MLAVDHSKFGRTASVRIGTITEVDAVFTDQPLPAGLRQLLRGLAVQVVVPKG